VEKIVVSSPAFSDGGEIPVRHTCRAENLSPPLSFHGVPAEAMSLCLVLEDLDNPGGPSASWVVWNIPTTTVAVDENGMTRVPGAVVGVNDARQNRYIGPCRPLESTGYERRRYRITVRALDELLELEPTSNREALMRAIEGRVLAKGTLSGSYRWY
jgi:Raf kinase inhibitor-like YbhB/YbcL family protein